MADGLPAIAPAVDGLRRAARGAGRARDRPAALDFEASYGRTTLEYYDGFVFGFTPRARPAARGHRAGATTR
jgi:hypothetical protein